MNTKDTQRSHLLRLARLPLLAALGMFASAEAFASTCVGPQPTICSRSCWGARSSGCSTTLGSLTRAIIHYTAGAGDWTTSLETAKSRVRGIQNYHMDSNGWCDIGYHFLISAGGHVFEGRIGSLGSSSSWRRGAHDACNANSMGFSCMGDFHPPNNQSFTAAMQDSLYDVIAWRMPSGWSPYGSGTYCNKTVGRLDGHRKVVATTCPGDIIWGHIGNDYNGGNARNGVASRRSCSSGVTVTVDNSSSGFSASADWASGTSATDKYGTDYRYRSTAPVSDPATWTASLPSSGTYSVSAWWSQGTNRSATAPYIVYHSSGSTTVNANQQANGGKWNLLGNFSLSAGSNQVALSCWTATGYVVVADAVRWTK